MSRDREGGRIQIFFCETYEEWPTNAQYDCNFPSHVSSSFLFCGRKVLYNIILGRSRMMVRSAYFQFRMATTRRSVGRSILRIISLKLRKWYRWENIMILRSLGWSQNVRAGTAFLPKSWRERDGDSFPKCIVGCKRPDAMRIEKHLPSSVSTKQAVAKK